MSCGCTLIAIARNEEKYVLEWLAYNLSIGFEKIILFENASTDGTAERISRAAGNDPRISMISWYSATESPQCSAYNHGVKIATTPWIAFLDVDEFVVPWEHDDIPSYLATIPEEVSAVNVNWRSFGSSGRVSEDYALVTETFTRCAPPDFGSQLHFKTFARRQRVKEAFIHVVTVDEGRRVLTDLKDTPPDSVGVADRIIYNGIQVNHYQTKTWVEFQRRMKVGDAYVPNNHPGRSRDVNSLERFQVLDQNEDQDLKIQPYLAAMKRHLQHIDRNPRPKLFERFAVLSRHARRAPRG